jgi:hypothetical protein
MERTNEEHDDGVAEQIATAALVGLGVAALEIELLPGLLLGVGAMLLPKLVPGLSGVMRPLTKSVVRLGYGVVTTAQGMVAEAGEQVQDIIAEVESESRAGRASANGRRRDEAPV